MILVFLIVSHKYIQLLNELSLTVKCIRPLESRRRGIAVFHFKFAGWTGLALTQSSPLLTVSSDVWRIWSALPGNSPATRVATMVLQVAEKSGKVVSILQLLRRKSTS